MTQPYQITITAGGNDMASMIAAAQAFIDLAKAKPANVTAANGSVVIVQPVPVVVAPKPVPPPAPKPVPKIITQAASAWAHTITANVILPAIIANEHWTDGGGILALSTVPISVSNVSNASPNNCPGGHYALALLWPALKPDGTQQAVSKATFDLTGCTINQGLGEAILRTKCDDLTVIGGTFVAHKGADGKQVKPIVELRHGKQFHFIGTKFQGGYPEIGAQSTAQPDGSSKVDLTQVIGGGTFERCPFDTWTAVKNVYARKPGITGKITFIDCLAPDGKTFSRVD